MASTDSQSEAYAPPKDTGVPEPSDDTCAQDRLIAEAYEASSLSTNTTPDRPPAPLTGAVADQVSNQFMVARGFPSSDKVLAFSDAPVRADAPAPTDAPADKKAGAPGEGKDAQTKPTADDKKDKDDKLADKPADIPESGKEVKPPTELDKKIDKLIEKLGDDNFDTREKAQQDLVKRGVPTLGKLDAAKDNGDPEIIDRAGKAADQIRSVPPAEIKILADAHTAALKEIADKGKMSLATTEQYKKLIKEMDVKSLSDQEHKMRHDSLTRKVDDVNAKPTDRVAALNTRNQLSIMHEVKPGSQARLDYADALFKSGETSLVLQWRELISCL